MIDIENKIIDIISESMSIKVTSEYNWTEAESPVCYIRMLDNSTLEETQDGSLREHHARVTFRLEFYSNKSQGAKSEVKELLNTADEVMQDLKFTRTGYGFIPNLDRTWTRLYADYEAIVGEGRMKDGVTVHQMYRRS